MAYENKVMDCPDPPEATRPQVLSRQIEQYTDQQKAVSWRGSQEKVLQPGIKWCLLIKSHVPSLVLLA